MRLVFMGTPAFAALALEALLDAGEEVVGVVCQPDRPSGRGRKVTPPPVADVARRHGLPLIQPEGVRTDAFRAWFDALSPDLGVVVAYGHILDAPTLERPRLGCVNLHASLLPRWRGASPIQAAILAGDAETGVTLMQMDAGMDTGDMLAEVSTPIEEADTAASLHDRLATLGASLLCRTLPGLASGAVSPVPQDDQEATYAPRLRKNDGALDWTGSAQAIAQRVRALHPWPGTRTSWRGEPVRVVPPVEVVDGGAGVAAGSVVAAGPEGVDVACGDGRCLRLLRLQLPGRKPLPVEEFLRGASMAVGEVLT